MWPLDEHSDVETRVVWPSADVAVDINLWPIAASVALAALAAVLRHGERLHRDTGALV